MEYALRRLNREIYDVLVDPMIRTYVIRRGSDVSALEWFSALSNLAGHRLVAMKGGIDRMAARLATEVDVRCNSPVSSVQLTKRGEVEIEVAGNEDILRADACVVATRFHQAARILPQMTSITDPLAKRLQYNATAIVNLGYSVRTKTRALGVLPGTVENENLTLIWMDHNKDPSVAPEGHSLVSCYFDAAAIEQMGQANDLALVEIAERFVLTHFPELRDHRDLVHVTRWDDAIPNPAPGTYSAIAEFRKQLDDRSPIQLAGDYFTCTGQNSAIHWGQVAAANIDSYVGRRND